MNILDSITHARSINKSIYYWLALSTLFIVLFALSAEGYAKQSKKKNIIKQGDTIH
jgi:hypothetical protein